MAHNKKWKNTKEQIYNEEILNFIKVQYLDCREQRQKKKVGVRLYEYDGEYLIVKSMTQTARIRFQYGNYLNHYDEYHHQNQALFFYP